MQRLPITLAAALLSLPAFAQDSSTQMTGAGFSEACTRANESWISFCNGYIQAAVDSVGKRDGICIPSGTTRTELVTVVEKAITGSDQLKALNANEAVHFVMRKSYPCP
ncbi:hypothetical protein EJ074_16595 [Mesorhizobium sp. M3A.F.Ca.ET.080.04.2.1]|uniref:Rap1a/Tai family immunity protein n=1 Tax=Mesorhizobium sp. M3A.F.Ca.ET.080.04.2.1 TaxID=2493676 RepID=UPI000F750851|nr:Rap1a/Tai family immunity protein [Mesorhizobium sp. M3A.F.Ca.ET.080.04.2.1]AZO10569.1 hypothetical protein EJ074_16595 [Mesorhizobium sp. M3A.F.Ca.ET.080.04.2.1]RWF25664.1 MAG: hypothetical protein EOS64_03855 [Mesorhizobium sp.]